MLPRFLTVLIVISTSAGALAQAPADLRVTNAHLVAICLDGKPADGERKWRVIAPVSITATMRNNPRLGMLNAEPGIAVIQFTPETGHKYEIEVRGTVTMFSRRVWPRGEWTPVVRDRTTDRIVSSAPRWIESGCGAPSR